MRTLCHGNAFGIIGPLLGESTGHQWIPFTKGQWRELWCFFWYQPEKRLFDKQSRGRWIGTTWCSRDVIGTWAWITKAKNRKWRPRWWRRQRKLNSDITATSHERCGVQQLAQQRKHQSSALFPLCEGNPPVIRDLWYENYLHAMTSSRRQFELTPSAYISDVPNTLIVRVLIVLILKYNSLSTIS